MVLGEAGHLHGNVVGAGLHEVKDVMAVGHGLLDRFDTRVDVAKSDFGAGNGRFGRIGDGTLNSKLFFVLGRSVYSRHA